MTTTPSPQHQDNMKAIRIMIGCFLLFFFCWLLLGCSTKNKVKSTERYTSEIANVERVSELTKNDIQTDLTLNASSQTLTANENDVVDAEIDNPEKNFELNKETKDGKTTYSGKNIKNLRVANEKTTTQTKDTIGQKLSRQDKSKTSKDYKLEEKGKASGRTTDTELETKRTSTFVTIGIGAGIFCILILLFLFIYFRIKRGKENV